MRRHLQPTVEVLPEADSTPLELALHAKSTGLLPLPTPDGLHQPHLEALEQRWRLHHRKTRLVGQAERPLPMRHPRQQRLDMDSCLHRPPVGARRAPTSALAGERHNSRLRAALTGDFHEAVPHVAAPQVGVELLSNVLGQTQRQLRQALTKGPSQHRRPSPALHLALAHFHRLTRCL